MIEELDRIALVIDLPAHGLKQGDVGTVVLVHGTEGYEVEFITLKGETVAVVSLATDEVRPIGPREIANARNISEVNDASKEFELSFGADGTIRSRDEIDAQAKILAGAAS